MKTKCGQMAFADRDLATGLDVVQKNDHVLEFFCEADGCEIA